MSGWQDHGACRGSDADWFAPTPKGIAQAIRICQTCPVIAECAKAGRYEHDGVWGGLRPEERHVIQRRTRPAPCGTDAGYTRHLRTDKTPPCGACKAAHAEAWRRRNVA